MRLGGTEKGGKKEGRKGLQWYHIVCSVNGPVCWLARGTVSMVADRIGWFSRGSEMLKSLVFLCSDDATVCIGLSVGFSHFKKIIIIIIGFQNFRAGRAIRVLPFAERIDCVLEFHIGEGRPWSYYDLGDQAINLPLCSPPLHKVSWLSKGKKLNFLVEWSVGPILRWRVGPGHVVVLICENFLNSL